MPLKPSGKTPTSSPAFSSRSASALQARVLPALRASGARNGIGEHQVGAEQPQVPVRRVVVEQRQRRHHRVERQRAGVVADDQRAAVVGHVLQAARLDPEPLVVERPEGRGEHVVGQVGVEAELVDLVVAGDPAAQERQRAGELALPFDSGRGAGEAEGAPAVGGRLPRGKPPGSTGSAERDCRPGSGSRGRHPLEAGVPPPASRAGQRRAFGDRHRLRVDEPAVPAVATQSSNACRVV